MIAMFGLSSEREREREQRGRELLDVGVGFGAPFIAN